ncbi:MAG: hypothetical protein ACW992_04930, partial [Candidatus Thorarchaeota archaeon]
MTEWSTTSENEEESLDVSYTTGSESHTCNSNDFHGILLSYCSQQNTVANNIIDPVPILLIGLVAGIVLLG